MRVGQTDRVRTRLGAAAALLLVPVVACTEDPVAPGAGETATSPSPTDDETDRPAPTPSTSPSPRPSEPGVEIIAAASDFGTVLFDATGQAIYLFDLEETSEPRCYGACAEAWPPVLTDGAPSAGRRVRASLLGTTERADGTTQATYDGHPLYFYAHEGKHEVKCHEVFLNGGNWYAVQPTGRPAP